MRCTDPINSNYSKDKKYTLLSSGDGVQSCTPLYINLVRLPRRLAVAGSQLASAVCGGMKALEPDRVRATRMSVGHLPIAYCHKRASVL
jgi:hypothetical protein